MLRELVEQIALLLGLIASRGDFFLKHRSGVSQQRGKLVFKARAISTRFAKGKPLA